MPLSDYGERVIEFFFTIAIASLLSWMFIKFVENISKPNKMQEFSSLVKYKDGKVDLMEFAITTQISAKQAQRFLDARAKEFGGIQSVSEYGDVAYNFGKSKQKLLEE